jgi:hypothetical protein
MADKKEVRKKIDDIINISYELRGIIKNDWLCIYPMLIGY